MDFLAPCLYRCLKMFLYTLLRLVPDAVCSCDLHFDVNLQNRFGFDECLRLFVNIAGIDPFRLFKMECEDVEHGGFHATPPAGSWVKKFISPHC